MRKKQLILDYLELKYGGSEVYDNEQTMGINGVCVYLKKLKMVGFVGKTNYELCDWFGDGDYRFVMKKWFFKKYKLERVE
jgi:hypothetical protein